jgi:hypothetical protein|tara:strand:- start:145 stop:522 length:378 start_codon:yes stop_codon:yes gene_type:complete
MYTKLRIRATLLDARKVKIVRLAALRLAGSQAATILMFRLSVRLFPLFPTATISGVEAMAVAATTPVSRKSLKTPLSETVTSKARGGVRSRREAPEARHETPSAARVTRIPNIKGGACNPKMRVR